MRYWDANIDFNHKSSATISDQLGAPRANKYDSTLERGECDFFFALVYANTFNFRVQWRGERLFFIEIQRKKILVYKSSTKMCVSRSHPVDESKIHTHFTKVFENSNKSTDNTHTISIFTAYIYIE